MKALLSQVTRTAVIYWMTAFWVVFFTVNSLGSAIMVALAGTVWERADTQTRFLIVVSIIVNWTNTMMAFVHKGISSVTEGKPLIEGAARIEQTQTTETKTTATAP